jgi:hypothetical protein
MAHLIIQSAVKGVASGIGLVSEGITHHNERKQAQAEAQLHTGEENDQISAVADHKEKRMLLEEGDTEHWELDDAQDELMSVKSNVSSSSHAEEQKQKREIDPTKITDAFMHRHPLPETGPNPATDHSKLPLPVILPQRRPKARARGFIRAYAPDLAIKSIDQETFLDFIETFNQASLASPWLDAINLAGFATMALPPGISQAVQLAIMVSVKIAKDIQSRKRYDSHNEG